MSSLLNQIFRKKKHSQYANSQKSMEILLAPGSTTTSNSNNSARTLQIVNPRNPEDLQDLQSFSIKASSVFNTPMKKASFLQNLYGKFEDIGDYIHNPESAKLPFNTTEITVEDFKTYLTKLRASHESYLKDKAHASQESLEKEEITDITGSLMQCYRKVPQQYFDPQFHFNFTWLQHENEDIAKYHIDLSETLGMVEKNLYYQISTKFSTILNTIQDLTDQENRINKSLEAIKNIRTVNHKLKESNSGKIFEVMKLKRKQLNLQRTLQVLDMMNLVKKIVPTLKLLIQRGNFDHAVNLLNSSEQTLSQKLGSIKCLQICNSGFQQARTTLQQMLMSEFETRCLDYFSKCLSYTKAAAKEQGAEEEERDDLQSRRLKKDLYVDSLNKELLEWTLEDVGENSTIADQMSKIILAHIKLKEVSLSSFRPQLNDLFKKFHKQFTTDMSEHLAGLNQRIENPQERAAMAFDLKVEFMTFYFRAYKRFFINFSEVNNKILSKVINYFDSKLIADPDSKESHAANANAVKILTHTAQEFYSIFTVVVRNFNDKMAQVIQQVEINNASASQFLAFEEAFDELVCFFKEKFDFQEKLYSSITTPKESLKKTLMKTISSFLDQMSISAVTSLRLLSEKQFIQTFFARKKDDLIKKLKQEKWQAVDVPFDQLENLRLLFDHSEVAKNSNSSPIVSASTEASEVNSARIKDIQEDEPPSPLMEIEKKHPLTMQSSVITIKKKTATINGKKYKLSESFLEIAQSIAELYSLSQKFSSIREESISKMMSLVKIFSSTIDYDILKGNATSGAKGGVITPEILAFGASSLVLLEQAIGILKARYEKSHEGLSDVLENETKQVTSELENLNSKLLLKISEILRDVVLVDRCAKLKTVRWQDSQEKASVPTQHSSQIIDKIGSVYKKISVYLPQENLAAAFRVVLGDIGKYYVPIFEEFDVANGLSAKRIKGELCYFVDSLKRIEIFGDFETDLLEFEERISTITDHKCGPFIELASLDEENEVEAG